MGFQSDKFAMNNKRLGRRERRGIVDMRPKLIDVRRRKIEQGSRLQEAKFEEIERAKAGASKLLKRESNSAEHATNDSISTFINRHNEFKGIGLVCRIRICLFVIRLERVFFVAFQTGWRDVMRCNYRRRRRIKR